MNLKYIQAIGNLLENYYSDLNYISNFHRYKSGKISKNDYLKKSEGSFKNFINGYRIARNVKKAQTGQLLKLTIKWTKSNLKNDVDNFAAYLYKNGITRHESSKSLASKILFLNNPWDILPMDTLSRKAVNLNDNDYKKYKEKVEEFKHDRKSEINRYLNSINKQLTFIEKKFKNEIRNINLIRKNRMIDKMLWSKGRQ